MACAAATESNDDLECSICLQPYQDPCILPCKHSFCCYCLSKWVEASDDHTVVVCPKCKSTAAIPLNGIKSFLVKSDSNGGEEEMLHQDLKMESERNIECTNCEASGNAATMRCMECKEFLCTSCHKHHKELKVMKHHTVVPVEEFSSAKEAASIDVMHCSKHDNELKRYYCETCQCLICSDCLLLTHQPPKHQSLRLKEASEKFKATMRNLLQACTDKRTIVQAKIDQNEKLKERVEGVVCQAKLSLEEARKEVELTLAKRVQSEMDKHTRIIAEFENDRYTMIDNIQSELKSILKNNQETCKRCAELVQNGSFVELTFSFASLSKDLQEFIRYTPRQDNREIPHVEFMATQHDIMSME